MEVQVGTEFESYEALTKAIRMFEEKNFVNLIVRDTRTVKAAAKRNQRKAYNPAIKYSDISFCCTYGGKKYVSHSTGKRNHKTIKQSCPFSLKVRATGDGQRLFVREYCDAHNHALSEAEFRFHPKQRKLDVSSQEEVATLLSLEPDKRLLRQRLMEVTGKVILMKDIHNIKTRMLANKTDKKDGPYGPRKTKKEEKSISISSTDKVGKLEKGASKTMCKVHESISKALVLCKNRHENNTPEIKNVNDDNGNYVENQTEANRTEIPIQRKGTGGHVSQLNTALLSQVVEDQQHVLAFHQELQPCNHAPVLIQHQPKITAPSVSTAMATILHHSYLDTSTHQHHQLHLKHQQQQPSPTLPQPHNMHTINIQQVAGEQVYTMRNLPQQKFVPMTASMVNTSANSITTISNPVSLAAILRRSDSPVAITSIAADTGCGLEDTLGVNTQDCPSYAPVDSVASHSHVTSSSALEAESIDKSVGVQATVVSVQHSVSFLACSQSQSQLPHTEELPSFLDQQQLQTHLNTTTTGSSNYTVTHSLLEEIGDSMSTSQPSGSPSSVLAPSSTSDVPDTCISRYIHRYRDKEQENLQQRQRQDSDKPAVLDSRFQSCATCRSNVDGCSESLSLPKRFNKWAMKREGARKTRRSAIERDKDNLQRKYFQQATVNLFFNERLKHSGNQLCQTIKPYSAKMSGGQEDLKYNDALKPLSWLFGKWRSEGGSGKYPTITDFTYIEEAEFSPIGLQPNVEYKFYSCHPTTKAPMHRETGFIKIKPGTNHIAFVTAHNFGVVDTQEGEVKDQELSVASSLPLGRTSFNKDPQVKKTTRTLKRTSDQLEHVFGMETDRTSLTEHLRITFKKI
ncbi:THAP domain-containing protein 4 [Elysia marginata]|uniref:THAP domain-containing protein 4 n=1 Tax=Elysia marginata TaxID=1093978 RepID=A0AAV4JJU8_9GAST|nr:THAP domain-containing protein 4 [Elysia marginata]